MQETDDRLLSSLGGTSDTYAASPERFSVTNLSTHVEVVAQFNPTDFETAISAEFSRVRSPGGSRQKMHFGNTNNFTVSLELYFTATNEADYKEINAARHYIESWCYPRSGTAFNPGNGPPVLLAVWPLVFAIECFLLSATFKNTRFAPDGRCTRFTASVKFEECRDKRLTSEDVAQASVIRGIV